MEAAQKASQFNDRTLFIGAIMFLVLCMAWLIRYGVKQLQEMVEKSHKVAEGVSVVVALNTDVHRRTTEALDNNSSVITDCQTELVRCRQHNDEHGRRQATAS